MKYPCLIIKQFRIEGTKTLSGSIICFVIDSRFNETTGREPSKETVGNVWSKFGCMSDKVDIY